VVVGVGPLPILLGTDVPLRFSKHPTFIYSIFLKTIPMYNYISVENPDPIRYFITM
jgi:hypothetical protein